MVAGPFDALDAFEKKLNAEGAACRRLVTSHAFHSAMMDPILEPFTKCVEQIALHRSDGSVCLERHRHLDHE